MLDSTALYLGLAYLAIGAAFAWLADHAAIKDLPAWYRRERFGWLARFALLWPLCLVLLLLARRWGKGGGSGDNPGKEPERRVDAAARGRHPATVRPAR